MTPQEATAFASSLTRVLLRELVHDERVVVELDFSNTGDTFVELWAREQDWHLEGDVMGTELMSPDYKWWADTWPEFNFVEVASARDQTAVLFFLEDVVEMGDEDLLDAIGSFPGLEDQFGADWDEVSEDELLMWVKSSRDSLVEGLYSMDATRMRQLAESLWYTREYSCFRLTVPELPAGQGWAESDHVLQNQIMEFLTALRVPDRYGACDLLLALIALHGLTDPSLRAILSRDPEWRVSKMAALASNF